VELLLTKRDLDLAQQSATPTAAHGAIMPWLDSMIGLSSPRASATEIGARHSAQLERVRAKHERRIFELHGIIDRFERALKESRHGRSTDAKHHARAIRTFVTVLRKAKDALVLIEMAEGPPVRCVLFHAEVDAGIRALSSLRSSSEPPDELQKERAPILEVCTHAHLLSHTSHTARHRTARHAHPHTHTDGGRALSP
jgi:hypothetical protein